MDDDAGTRMLVSHVLKKDGYDVLAADNGAAGLALIREHKPDLVVSDVQMPEMDGFQVVESVRADGDIAATPIILLTSLAERGHMRQGMTTGADDYLTKPFTPAELRESNRPARCWTAFAPTARIGGFQQTAPWRWQTFGCLVPGRRRAIALPASWPGGLHTTGLFCRAARSGLPLPLCQPPCCG